MASPEPIPSVSLLDCTGTEIPGTERPYDGPGVYCWYPVLEGYFVRLGGLRYKDVWLEMPDGPVRVGPHQPFELELPDLEAMRVRYHSGES